MDTLNSFIEELREAVLAACLRIVNLDGTYQWHCSRCGKRSTPQSTIERMEENMTAHWLDRHWQPKPHIHGASGPMSHA